MLHFLVRASDPTVTPDPFHVEISRPNSGLQLGSCPGTPKRGSASSGDRRGVSTWAKTRAPAQGATSLGQQCRQESHAAATP